MTDTTLRESAVLQFNVIRALILRDMTGRYGDSRLGYIWSMARPLGMLTILYGSAVLSHHEEVQGMPTLVFLTGGYLSWLCFEFTYVPVAATSKTAAGLLMFPHITLLDAIIASAITEWGTYTVIFLMLSVLTILIEHAALPADPLKVLFFFWVSSWMGAAVGVWIIVIRRFFTAIDNIITPIRRLGVFMSGPMVPAALIPPSALKYFSWNPVYGAIEIVRQAWYPAYQSPMANPRYVLTCLFFLMVSALLAERATRHKER